MAQLRRAKLADIEKRIDECKKKKTGGKNHEFEMADLLSQYGEMCKKVDKDLAEQK